MKVAQQRNQRSQKKWLDDRNMLQDFIQGITSTREIVKVEQKKLLEELSSEAATLDHSDVNIDLFVALEDRRNELSRIQMKIKEVEKEEAEVRCHMSNRVRGQELEIWETKLTVLQVFDDWSLFRCPVDTLGPEVKATIAVMKEFLRILNR